MYVPYHLNTHSVFYVSTTLTPFKKRISLTRQYTLANQYAFGLLDSSASEAKHSGAEQICTENASSASGPTIRPTSEIRNQFRELQHPSPIPMLSTEGSSRGLWS